MDTTLESSYDDFVKQYIILEFGKYVPEEVKYYQDKVNQLFKGLTKTQINKFLNAVIKRYGPLKLNNGTKAEGHKITIISDGYILRINRNSNKYKFNQLFDLYKGIYNNKPKFIEEIIQLGKLTNDIIFSLHTKYTPITEEWILQNKLQETFVKNIREGLKELEKLGYYHSDVSVDNSVWDEDNKKFRVIDFDMFKSIHDATNGASGHVFRDSFKRLE
jgi:hypothetical protein